MDWQTLASKLFPGGHDIVEHDSFLSGSGQVDAGAGADAAARTVAVIGTTGHAPIGIEIALAQAQAVLRTVREHPGRAILILVDTQGQRLRHRDEMLGINSYMAHLGKCIDFARRQGHTVLGLVYDQALSGGFITSGLIADACFALPQATIRVMGLPAMARITKVPEDRLTELAMDNPVFAPGAENYLRMGGLQAIWEPGPAVESTDAAAISLPDASANASASASASALASALAKALAQVEPTDRRMALGEARGGRHMAQAVAQAVRTGGDVRPA